MQQLNTSFDATLNLGVDPVTDIFGLIIESRGGTQQSNNYRNPEQSLLLQHILQCLNDHSVKNVQFYVASNSNRYLSNQERLLKIEGKHNFDFGSLSISIFTMRLREAIKRSGQVNGATGGNINKRLLLSAPIHKEKWLSILMDPSEVIDDIPPTDLEHAWRRLRKRLKQSKFRAELIKAYEGKCAITGTDIEEVLEAAHIIPYFGPASSIVTNGILLRSDIHELFDEKLIKIGSDYTILIDDRLANSEYWKYHKEKINLPLLREQYPDFKEL